MKLSTFLLANSEDGAKWTKQAFIVINVCLVLYALLLLLISSHEQAATVVSPSLPVLGGLQLGAVIMLAPAVLGGVMVFRPRVRLLFAYSLLTLLPMFILIVAAIACASVSEEKTVNYARVGLNSASDSDRAYVRDRFGCCTDVEVGDVIDDGGGKVLVAGDGEQLLCPSCNHAVGERIGEAFSVSGAMAAGGVLLQLLSLYLSHAYIKCQDPMRPIYFVNE